ncbi:2,3,4,5-tetrahydropyridine-2,6-carboxylate N-succinyltransferase [Rhodobacterales bacterium HKCCE3408]|nr:2,3,4,5-tetrahydropyridine-2,6-carboxylate N-succinyltransferase [Rhodobacterales bacterium HKCCE3408]
MPATELNISSGSALEMADTLFGDNILILAARYFGDNRSSGIWSSGDAQAPDLTAADSGVILSTGRVRDVTNTSGNENASTNTSTNTRGVNNDPDFNAIAGTNTYDAAILEVDFVPDTDLLSIQFTFASEEYPEYVGSLFNDTVGVWINGQLVESAIFDISQINNLNQGENETLFIDNSAGSVNTEMDGLTVTLSLYIPVTAGQTNTLKIGIADVADSVYDSSLLISANSIQGVFIAYDDTLIAQEGVTKTIDVLANDDNVGQAFVTHVNGKEIAPGGSITLNSGHVITLTVDGLLQVAPPPDQVGLTDPETINFSYTASAGDGSGYTDTAFVTVTAIPCFAAGTLIRTGGGDVPVELLAPGDLIETRDDGQQPIRWIGRRRVAAEGAFAPIVIEPGTFGHHERLVLSPQHRVLIRHHMAELLFGEDEVLVAAKDLVNGVSVHVREGGEVTYFHLLFDRHQMVWSEGLLTESFLPGPQTLPGFERDLRAELCALFPGLDPETGQGYGPSARPGLRSYEARALLG